MKLKAYFSAALVCAAVGGWVVPAAANFPQPGDVVDKSNMARRRMSSIPRQTGCSTQGMSMKVIEYRKYEWPRAYAEATEKFAGQVQLSEDGRQMFNYVAGCPFPSIDVNDPLAGRQGHVEPRVLS